MSAELDARRVAAAAVLADFAAEDAKAAHGPFGGTDWAAWAFRLAAELGSVLGQLDAGQAPAARVAPAATGVLLDGSAWLTHADMLTVLGALHEAAGATRQPGMASQYAAVAWRLGDDR